MTKHTMTRREITAAGGAALIASFALGGARGARAAIPSGDRACRRDAVARMGSVTVPRRSYACDGVGGKAVGERCDFQCR